MKDHAYEFDSTAALDVLAASPLFARLDRAARAELADHLSFVSLAAGETLFRQGDPGTSMYIVERGLLDVVVRAEGATQLLDRLDAGASVGEMALLTGRPRTADAVAVVAAPVPVMADPAARPRTRVSNSKYLARIVIPCLFFRENPIRAQQGPGKGGAADSPV